MPLLDDEKPLSQSRMWMGAKAAGLLDLPEQKSMIPFYPSSGYIKKNWAPERIPAGTLTGIKMASDAAVKAGVLSKSLAAKMIPNLLVEGRGGGPGVVWDDDLKQPVEVAGSSGVSLGVTQAAMNALRPSQIAQLKKMGIPAPEEWGDLEWEEPFNLAGVAAVILSEKAARYGEGKAIERWNGVGPWARNHARKVAEMERMLNNPKNKELRRILQTW